MAFENTLSNAKSSVRRLVRSLEEAAPQTTDEDTRSFLKRNRLWIFKLVLTVLLVFLIIRALDIDQFTALFTQLDIGFLVAGAAAYFAAQLVSVLRLRYYLIKEKLTLSKDYLFLLYFSGMFFNTFLPGSVTGDGYIAYRLNRQHKLYAGTAVRRMLSVRASGLYCLLGFVLLMAAFLQPSGTLIVDSSFLAIVFDYWIFVLVVSAVVLSIGYTLSARFILKEPYSMQVGALPYSLVVHGLNVLVTIALLAALPGDALDSWIAYTAIFFLSGVAGMMPITVGGIGIRELCFVFAASYFAIELETGVALAFVFFVVNLAISAIGIFTYWKLSGTPKSSEN